MTVDILDKIDNTLTFYSAGLGQALTVPVERPSVGRDHGRWIVVDETHVWVDRVESRLRAIAPGVFNLTVEFSNADSKFIAMIDGLCREHIRQRDLHRRRLQRMRSSYPAKWRKR